MEDHHNELRDDHEDSIELGAYGIGPEEEPPVQGVAAPSAAAPAAPAAAAGNNTLPSSAADFGSSSSSSGSYDKRETGGGRHIGAPSHRHWVTQKISPHTLSRACVEGTLPS